MKKRLPILIVFMTALFVVIGILITPESAAVLNGQEEVKIGTTAAEKGVDQDHDGVQGDLTAAEMDPDDNNACIPDNNCPVCDQDGDGLTLEKEKELGSDPTEKDTDGDGLDDSSDKCVNEFGLVAHQGCKVVIDARLDVKNKRIEWNSQLNSCGGVILTIRRAGSGEVIVRQTCLNSNFDFNRKEYPNQRPGQFEVSIELTSIAKKSVTLSGNTTCKKGF